MFLWHFPSGRPAWVLPSALPCGARTFLSRLSATADARPTPGLLHHRPPYRDRDNSRSSDDEADGPGESIRLGLPLQREDGARRRSRLAPGGRSS